MIFFVFDNVCVRYAIQTARNIILYIMLFSNFFFIIFSVFILNATCLIAIYGTQKTR